MRGQYRTLNRHVKITLQKQMNWTDTSERSEMGLPCLPKTVFQTGLYAP